VTKYFPPGDLCLFNGSGYCHFSILMVFMDSICSFLSNFFTSLVLNPPFFSECVANLNGHRREGRPLLHVPRSRVSFPTRVYRWSWRREAVRRRPTLPVWVSGLFVLQKSYETETPLLSGAPSGTASTQAARTEKLRSPTNPLTNCY